MHYVSLIQLRRNEACSGQRQLFEDTFGSRVRITEALCVMWAHRFSWQWAIDNLVAEERRTEARRAARRSTRAYRLSVRPMALRRDLAGQRLNRLYRKKHIAIQTWRNRHELHDLEYAKAIAPYTERFNVRMAKLFARYYLGE